MMWAARKAFHRDEVLPADNAQIDAQERHFNASRKRHWIEAPQAAQELDSIAVGIIQDKHAQDWILVIAAAKRYTKPGCHKNCGKSFQASKGCVQQRIDISRSTYGGMRRERESTDHQVVDFFARQQIN